MSEPSKGIPVDAVDRISSLPRNVIDCIMECMPFRAAVRTSVLSRKWQYLWADYPCLLLDKQFSHDIKLKRQLTFQNDFIHIVNGILLQHHGPILKFVLDISDVNPAQYSYIDKWFIYLSRMGVRELKLDNSHHRPYKIPSSIFSYPEFTDLSISNAVFRPPNTVKCFGKLNKLYLEKVTLEPWVLSTPLLVSLRLSNCRGIPNFKISAPILDRLFLIDNDDLDLSQYIICKDIRAVCVWLSSGVEHQGLGEKMAFTKNLGRWPQLLELCLDGFSLKCLAAHTIQERLPFTLNHLRLLVLIHITFDLDQISSILCLLRSSLILHNLEIWVSPVLKIDTKIHNLLKEAVVQLPVLDQLRSVKVRHFKGSAAELFFIKLLLGSSPSLESMFVEEDQKLDLIERYRLSKELMQLSRASPNAKIVFEPKIPRTVGSIIKFS